MFPRDRFQISKLIYLHSIPSSRCWLTKRMEHGNFFQVERVFREGDGDGDRDRNGDEDIDRHDRDIGSFLL